MAVLQRVVLDVLKPHEPNAVEFCRLLAAGAEQRIRLRVLEVDEKTETLQLVIEGPALDFEQIQQSITTLGASLHSIDEVEVLAGAGDEEPGG